MFQVAILQEFLAIQRMNMPWTRAQVAAAALHKAFDVFPSVRVQHPLGVDLEERRIGRLREIDIEQRDQGLVALRIGDMPLLQLEGLGIENQLDQLRAAECGLVFDGNDDAILVFADAESLDVSTKVDPLLQQEFQRRLADEIHVVRRELSVANRNRGPIGNDLKRGRLGIFEA